MQEPFDVFIEEFRKRQPAWMNEGVCRKENLPHSWFFTDNADGSRRGEKKLKGKEACKRCPVREECLRYAMENNEKHGIFGGLTSSERRRLRRTGERPQGSR